MSFIANKLKAIKPSPTLAITNQAAEMRAQGIDVISLSAGEPDFDTPDNIKAAAKKAIDDGKTKYTPVPGMAELRKAIQQKFKRDNNIEVELDEIIVSTGGKQVIFNALFATLNSDEKVLIPAPYWVSYPDMTRLAGGEPKIIQCGADFKITPELLEQNITAKTKWLILNSPSNPTGAVYSKAELIALAEIVRQHENLYVFSDDIYEHILYSEEKFYTLAEIAPDLRERIFTMNGVSKGYSMTGRRIGFGTGNKELIKMMSKVQSQSTSNASSISQMASIEALQGTQEFLAPNCQGFREKRDLALELINDIPGLSCTMPAGAFYLFVKCDELFGSKTPDGAIIANSTDLAAYLLTSAKVALVPGIAFGVEGYFRISYATSKELISTACTRIKTAIGNLSS